MKAIILEKVGGVENLILKDIEQASANENEVVIEVKAISIDPADIKVRNDQQFITNLYANEKHILLGWGIAGTVVSKGENANQFEIGEKVFGLVNFPGAGNAYAEFVAAPQNHLAKIPDNISFEEAAASTMAAITPLQALKGKIKKDDRVLIHAGSGGVGHFAVQLAKSKGAYVITTTSAKNRDFVLSLGADEHIDYRTKKFEEVVKDIDVVLDPFGTTLMNSLKVVKEGGSIVSLSDSAVPPEVQAAAAERNVTVNNNIVISKGEDMNTIGELLKSGAIKAHVTKTFAFKDMALAHTQIESGRTVGKIVVKL